MWLGFGQIFSWFFRVDFWIQFWPIFARFWFSCGWISGRFLVVFWVDFWAQFWPILVRFWLDFGSVMVEFRADVLLVFWTDFWVKFWPIFARFWFSCSWVSGKFLDSILTDFGIIFGSISVRLWLDFGQIFSCHFHWFMASIAVRFWSFLGSILPNFELISVWIWAEFWWVFSWCLWPHFQIDVWLSFGYLFLTFQPALELVQNWFQQLIWFFCHETCVSFWLHFC